MKTRSVSNQPDSQASEPVCHEMFTRLRIGLVLVQPQNAQTYGQVKAQPKILVPIAIKTSRNPSSGLQIPNDPQSTVTLSGLSGASDKHPVNHVHPVQLLPECVQQKSTANSTSQQYFCVVEYKLSGLASNECQ